MRKLRDNVSLYFSLLKMSLKEILIYRVDCIVGACSQLVVQLVSLIFILIVFQNTETFAGWTFKQILLLYGITRIPVAIVLMSCINLAQSTLEEETLIKFY